MNLDLCLLFRFIDELEVLTEGIDESFWWKLKTVVCFEGIGTYRKYVVKFVMKTQDCSGF